MRTHLQVIVPLFNESDVLPELISRLTAVLALLSLNNMESTVLFVNDGSDDASPVFLEKQAGDDLRFGYLFLSRNFGHQAALSAGLDHADADLIVILDADLQDPPELIPEMVRLWRTEKADVVYGVRKNRKENLFKRLCYAGFYRFFGWLTGLALPLDSGDFSLMTRRAYTTLREMPERVRFMRGLRHWMGFKQCPLPYDRPKRFAGDTKYSFYALYKLATDGLASFSIAPLRAAQFFAFLFGLLTMVVFLFLVLRPDLAAPRLLALISLIVCFSFSMLFLCVYILGAYISRIYQEVKKRPLYIVAESKLPRPSASS